MSGPLSDRPKNDVGIHHFVCGHANCYAGGAGPLLRFYTISNFCHPRARLGALTFEGECRRNGAPARSLGLFEGEQPNTA